MSRVHRSRYLVLMLVLIAIAATEFVSRSILRGDGDNDFATPYVSTVRFLHGVNPYSSSNFLADWHAAGAPADREIILAGQYSIYPPITLVALTPVALAPWNAAVVLYRALSVILFLGLVYCLALKIGEGWGSLRRLGFVVFSLALTSVQAGIHQGNPSVLAFTLCAFALLSAERGHEALAGVLLAIGFCLKPTSAPAAILIMLLYWRKKTLSVFVVLAVLIAGVAFGVMSRFDPVWKIDYQNNLGFMFGPLGGASFTTDSAGRFDLLNLQVPLYALLHHALDANLAAWGIAGLLGVVWLWLFYFRRPSTQSFSWLAIASLSLIGLLPVYQRNYNIGFVLFALMWAFGSLQLRTGKAIVWVSILFLIPGEALLRRLPIAASLAHNVVWNCIVMSQAVWAVVAIVCLLLYAQFSHRRTAAAA